MSLQWMDDFNTYGGGTAGIAAANQGAGYVNIAPNDSTQFPNDPDPSATGRVYRVGMNIISGYSNDDGGRFVLPTPGTKIGVGARRWFGALGTGAAYRQVVWSFRSTVNAKMYELILETNGALSIWNSAGTQLATTTSPVISTAQWIHIAMKVDTVAGTFRVEIEGNNVASLSSAAFAPTSALMYQIGYCNKQDGLFSVVSNDYMKDFVVWDSSGSQNNGMVGPVGVYRLSLASDVSSGWTRSSGTTDYGLLNETGPNDVSMISAGSALPAASIMGVSSLPLAITSIRGVMPLIRLQKSDAGDCSIVNSLVSGASTAAGATKTPSTTFAYFYDIIELDPATAALWTPTAVNAVKVKINRTV